MGFRQKGDYVLAGFAKQCAEIKAAKCEPEIRVGNIHVSRDFIDVRDVVRAYSLILEKGKSGEVYNMCSGRLYQIGSLVCGSNRNLQRDTNWQPEIPIEKTLSDLLDYMAIGMA